MNIFKKAALNLSVEAIIIFVLAFAMLGVGIFVTQQVQETASEGLLKARELVSTIDENPTAEKTIVGISSKGFELPVKKELETAIKYYNAERTTATEAIPLIDECKSSSTGVISSYANDGEYPINVVAVAIDVGASDTGEFPMVLQNTNLLGDEKYICKLKIVKESKPATEYESLTFLLTVSA
jgi:hypothetical protein